LICWENYLPLARAALYEAGIDVLLAPTWDNSDEWVPTLRHIAKEGQIFVVGVTPFLRGSDVPRDIEGAAEIYGGNLDLSEIVRAFSFKKIFSRDLLSLLKGVKEI
jgi:hypothetical protein